jgi:hypothetical protein
MKCTMHTCTKNLQLEISVWMLCIYIYNGWSIWFWYHIFINIYIFLPCAIHQDLSPSPLVSFGHWSWCSRHIKSSTNGIAAPLWEGVVSETRQVLTIWKHGEDPQNNGTWS